LRKLEDLQPPLRYHFPMRDRTKKPRVGTRLQTALSAAGFAVACWPNAASAGVDLQPYSHTYRVVATVNGKPVVTAQWKDTLDEITVAGKKALRRTQVSLQTNGRTRTWVSIFEHGSLAPIADTFNTSEGEIFARTFSADAATSYSSSGADLGILKTSKTQLPQGYSDFNGGQFGLALLGLPLVQSYKTTLITFGPTDAAVQLIPIEVLRREQIDIAGRSVEALVVRATFAAKYYPDEGENYMTFWLTREAPYIARLVTEAPRQHLRVTFDLES
jgi:hypothetical protein